MANPFLLPGMVDPSWQQPMPAPQPAAPAGVQGGNPNIMGALQQAQQLLQQQYQQLPGQSGAEQGALTELMKLYGQKQSGPDPALLQLAAGFLSPTRTGGFGESLGYAASGYGGALQKQREQEFDKATKLAQLRMTQAQLANRLPQLQQQNLAAQVENLSKQAELQKVERDEARKLKSDAAFSDFMKSRRQPGGEEDDFTPLTREQEVALQMEPDPAKRAQMLSTMTKPKDLSQNTIVELGTKGGAYGDFNRLVETWNPKYGARGFGAPLVGGIQNWAGARGMPEYKEQSKWWADYQTQKNLTRNQLFGSALTKTEAGEFDKANIEPGMDPDVIKENLARQREAARAAAAKLAHSWAKQGYSKKAIESATGFKLKELGEPQMRDLSGGAGQGPAVPGAPSVGQVVDGYRFKGGNPASQSSWEKVQ